MTDLPPSMIGPVRLAEGTPNGFLVSHRPAGAKMLTLNWDDEIYAMHLDGDRPFRYFPLNRGVAVRGALIKEVEFRVDVTSAYNAVERQDPLGALILTGGQLYVIAVLIGDGWADPVEVPLWGEFDPGTGGEKVGFTRWGIVARDGAKLLSLFSHECAT